MAELGVMSLALGERPPGSQRLPRDPPARTWDILGGETVHFMRIICVLQFQVLERFSLCFVEIVSIERVSYWSSFYETGDVYT